MLRFSLTIMAMVALGVQAKPCDINLKKDEYQFKNQNHVLDVTTSIDISQWVNLAVIKEHKARVATNITCQAMVGKAFTGSDLEWQGFYKSALNGLLVAKAKDIQFTLIGDDKALYTGNAKNYKEYRFDADLGGNQQVIKNFTVLNLDKNEVITVSVSGNEVVEDEIKTQYKKVIEELGL